MLTSDGKGGRRGRPRCNLGLVGQGSARAWPRWPSMIGAVALAWFVLRLYIAPKRESSLKGTSELER